MLNDKQQAVVEAGFSENILVNASAGTGKTTVGGLRAYGVVDKSTLAGGAFNSSVVAFNKSKYPPEMHTRLRSFNGHGHQALLRHYEPSSPDHYLQPEKGYWMCVDEVKKRKYEGKLERRVVKLLKKLHDLVRYSTTDVSNGKAIEKLMEHHSLESPIPIVELQVMVGNVLSRGIGEANKRIDYIDQVYLPATNKDIEVPKYDTFLADECLPYKTPILLADGTSMQIGDIVENGYEGEVLAYDILTYTQKPCKIIARQKIANQKPLVKITAKWKERRGTNNPSNFVVCTIDHKVWCRPPGQAWKWKEAGKIQPGWSVQVETSAQKSQHYKITSAGRETLSDEMTSKNCWGKMITNQKKCGRVPEGKQGGNGRGLTEPQRVLAEELGEGWTTEYAVATKQKVGSGYPTCYKIDIANTDRMIAVEVDGASHCNPSRRVLDAKKTDFLEKLGWTVIRVTNRNAIQKTAEVVAQITQCHGDDCPIEAVVTKVEASNIPDYFVYDITVEDCHNFYANGILVHNCQDMNIMQQKLLMRLGKHITAFGDKRQSVYGWASADTQAMDTLNRVLKAKVMPLTKNYRCPKSVITLVKELWPEIEAWEEAPEGVIDKVSRKDVSKRLLDLSPLETVITCRTNAPLIEMGHHLTMSKIPWVLQGRGFHVALEDLVSTVTRNPIRWSEFLTGMKDYQNRRSSALLREEGNEMLVAELEDRCESVRTFYYAADEDGISNYRDFLKYIEAQFQHDNTTPKDRFLLATGHGVKGKEFDHVFFLRPDLCPHHMARQAWQIEQERNLLGIIYTRTKRELHFVQEPVRSGWDASWDVA